MWRALPVASFTKLMVISLSAVCFSLIVPGCPKKGTAPKTEGGDVRPTDRQRGATKEEREAEKHLSALSHKNPDTRLAALKELALSKDPRVFGAVESMLQDSDERVRQTAVEIMRAFRDPRAVTKLVSLTKDPSTEVRRALIETLTIFEEKEAVGAVLEMVFDEDETVRRTALKSLAGYGSRAVASLVAEMKGANTEKQGVIKSALLQLGEKAVPHLAEAMRSEDRTYSEAAAQVLTKIGAPSIGTLKGLTEAPGRELRLLAVRALSRISGDDAVSALVSVLGSKDPAVRALVMNELKKRESKKLNQELMQKVSKSTGTKQKVICCAEVLISKNPEEAQKEIIELFSKYNDVYSRNHLLSLIIEGGEKWIHSLLRALKHKNSSIRRNVALALQRALYEAQSVRQTSRYLGTKTHGKRAKAFFNIINKTMKKHGLQNFLRSLSNDSDPEVRFAASWLHDLLTGGRRFWLAELKHAGTLRKKAKDPKLSTEEKIAIHARLASFYRRRSCRYPLIHGRCVRSVKKRLPGVKRPTTVFLPVKRDANMERAAKQNIEKVLTLWKSLKDEKAEPEGAEESVKQAQHINALHYAAQAMFLSAELNIEDVLSSLDPSTLFLDFRSPSRKRKRAAQKTLKQWLRSRTKAIKKLSDDYAKVLRLDLKDSKAHSTEHSPDPYWRLASLSRMGQLMSALGEGFSRIRIIGEDKELDRARKELKDASKKMKTRGAVLHKKATAEPLPLLAKNSVWHAYSRGQRKTKK